MAENTAATNIQGSISAQELGTVLQAMGYRATITYQGKMPVINSAAQGLGFSVVFGAVLPGATDRFTDFSFLCWLNVQGQLPPAVVDSWNQTKRFSRLFSQPARGDAPQALVLMMDVVLAGGVTDRNLRAQCELWDQLTRDLVLHLKQSSPAAAPAAA